MKRIRFNIASLLVVILVLGVGFAALRESSDLWESGLFTVTLGILLISILLAVHRTESRRAFWLGFALFGWIYLGLSLVPSIESRLITTKALHYLDSKVPGRCLRRHRCKRGRCSWHQKEHTIQPRFQGYIVKRRNQDGSLAGILHGLQHQVSGTRQRQDRELREDWSLAPRHRRRTLGGQLSRYLHTKNRQGDFGTGHSAGLDLEQFSSVS